jgi:hypothetical protein
MTTEEAIDKSTQALKIGIHENWVMLSLLAGGIKEERIPTIIRWAKQFNIKGLTNVEEIIPVREEST